MGAAFEVNRQMCDLEIARERWDKLGKEWDSKKKEIVYSIFKGNDMEKKKMTKAEAFEYLKDAKIYVDRQIEAVLEKLFKIGFTWKDGSQRVDLGWSSDDEVYGLIISDGKLSWVDKPCCGLWFDSLAMPRELRADDGLSIEIVEENRSEDELVEIVELGKKIQCLLSNLSGHRHVVITETDVLLYDEGMCLFHSDPF